jgi:hypothetical protein
LVHFLPKKSSIEVALAISKVVKICHKKEQQYHMDELDECMVVKFIA